MPVVSNTELRISLAISFLVGLLASFQSCKKSGVIDPPAPDTAASQKITLPDIHTAIISNVRSTSITFPDAMSVLSYPGLDTPMPSASCKIKRITLRGFLYPFYNESLGEISGKEKVYVNGKEYNVFVDRVTNYEYDQQGRITQEVSKSWRNRIDTTSYAYRPDRIFYRKSLWLGERIILNDTLPLNDQGLSLVRPDNYRYGIYDNNGYLSIGNWNRKDPQLRRIKVKVINDDIQTISDSLYNAGELTINYTTHLAWPNLPTITPFYGKESRHLLAEKILSTKQDRYYRDGPKYITKYVYQFDSQGRVTRCIVYGQALDSTWSTVEYQNGIALIDYEYVCP